MSDEATKLPRSTLDIAPSKPINERHQITYSKRVTHAVKIVDSCSRENGVLCTVARSWLLFPHDERAWKNFELNIARGVDELPSNIFI